jgi:glutamate-1-semialdehyde 2,1-aminomutase
MARSFTKRDKVLKFEGAYHGGHDTVLVSVKPPKDKSDTAPLPRALPVGQGIPALTVENTLVANWNDAAGVRTLLERHARQVAAVIVEPVMMNVGVMAPRDGFLAELRALCDEFGCLLVFDEVKTAAKLAYGGAQEYFKLRPDIVCLAKAVGGGLPLGAFGARRELMSEIGSFRSFHAGTYASNPLATTACITALDKILTRDVYPRVTALGDALAEGHNKIIRKYGHPWCAVNMGANGTVYWRRTPPTNYREWLDQDFDAFWRYWHMNLNRGVIPQAQCYDEQWTVSALHTEKDVDRMLEVFDEIAREMK